MAGAFGTVRPSNITANDVEIFYFYRPTRSSELPEFSTFRRLDNENLLIPCEMEKNDSAFCHVIPGVYDLRLPLDIFGNKGFYTIYIKPKEYYTTITDVSVLLAYPDVRGVVINAQAIDGLTLSNGALEGYRIEYFNDNGEREDYTRIITSSNRCQPVLQYTTDASSKATRYQFTNDSSDLYFCTVTPSSTNSYKANATPYIGVTGQHISLMNTKFNPLLIELEMVEHDEDTISTMLEGSQIHNLDTGMMTTYNDDLEAYHQSETYELKDRLGNPLYIVKNKRTTIVDEDFTEITEG